MYCPTMHKEIVDNVHLCFPYQTISKSQQKEPAISMGVPMRPWKALGMDLFLLNNK